MRHTAIMMAIGLAASAAHAAPADLHGAMPMAAQEKRLDALGLSDGAHPPARIDPTVWQSIVPADNTVTPERVALGRKLYFDARLSADGTVSCATCHDVSRGFTDQRPVSEGIRDQLGRRNAPTTMNALLMQTMFLDGRAPTLEAQAKLPIVNPIEMGQPDGVAAANAIAGDADYQKMFQAAYGRDPNYEDIGNAIAAFERTLVFLDAPFDAYVAGNATAISPAAQAGFALFNGKARCVTCHALNPSNPIGSDNRFHNIGVAARHRDFEKLAAQALVTLEQNGGADAVDQLALTTDLSELGRFLVSKQRSDIGAFKTPQLRNVALTAPYMHDGSMQTLWDVMDHYNKGGEANTYLDGGIEPLALSETEIDQLVAFMFTLTDRRFQAEGQAAFAAQQKRARTTRPFRDNALAQRKVLPFADRVMGDAGKEN